MRRLIIGTFLLLILSISNLYAKLQGQARIDSLLNELPRHKEDTNKVSLLNAISFVYSTALNAPDEGIKYGNEAMQLAAKLDWKVGMGRAGSCLGLGFQGKKNHGKAIEYFEQSIKTFESVGFKTGLAVTEDYLGELYLAQQNFPKALDHMSRGLKLCEEMGDSSRVANALTSLSQVYIMLENPIAVDYALKALSIYEKLGDKVYIAGTTNIVGAVYSDAAKNFPKALEYMSKALKMYEEMGDKSGICGTLGNMGSVYLNEKNYPMAIMHLETALGIAKEIGSKYHMLFNLDATGTAYVDMIENGAAAQTSKEPDNGGNEIGRLISKYKLDKPMPSGKNEQLQTAIRYLEQGLAMAREQEDLHRLQECYHGLGRAYRLKGDYQNALEAFSSYHAIHDTLYSQENKEQIVKLSVKNDYDRLRLTDSLKAAGKEKIAAINLQKQKTYTYLGIVGILVLSGFSFFIMKERRKSETERKKSDGLLLNILPVEVAEELKTTGTTTARHYDNVTVLFTDFINFTLSAEQMNAQDLIDELHNCFKAFDEITSKHDLEKIKTIGDAYLAVCGLPAADRKHAENVVRAATEINTFMSDRLAKMGSERTFAVRIGIHSGSVVAGIVGVKKFAYDIWGDTVNTAARMEQNSEAGKINISETTYELVKDKFPCEYRGAVEAKGKGVMKMYFVS